MSASDSRRRRAWRIPFPVALVILLDLTFNLYFWRLPKLTPRSADYGYQFLVDVQELSRPIAAARVRVLAFGSSVAGSFDPEQVESLLRATHPDRDLDVHRLLVPGIKPSDYLLFFRAQGEALAADIVVLPLNLADFQNPSVDRGVKPQVRNVLPPWPTLRAKWSDLGDVGDKLDLALAGVSHIYRYRSALRSALQDHAKWLLRRLRSHPTATYGFYPDGYTKRHFGFPASSFAAGRAEYFVDAEWIRQRGVVRLTAALGGRIISEQQVAEAGWHELAWPSAQGGELQVAADSTWTPRAGGVGDDVRLLGVRLRPALSLPPGGGRSPLGYPPFFDQPELLRMGTVRGVEFERRWRAAVEADDDFGHRVRAYRAAKTAIRDEVFAVDGEYAALRDLVGYFVEHGVRVVLINNPESPLILPSYAETDYYRAYRAFLRALAVGNAGVQYYDIAAELPAEDFNDWHHVSYIGAIKLGRRYAEMIESAWPQG